MTTDNPDPLEVWREACVAYGGLSIEGGEGERAAAAIIAQHYAPVIAENARLKRLAGFASQAFDTYVQQVNDRDPSESEAAYSSAFAALRDELDKALGAKP